MITQTKIPLIFFIILLPSCSTLNKSMVYSAIGVGTLSAFAGSALSPNKESRLSNAIVFGTVGAASGAVIGKYFFDEDPENQKLPSMILEEKKAELKGLELIPQGSIGISSPIMINALPVKTYTDLPSGPIPEELKAMAKKQHVIEYQIDGKVIQQGNSSYYIKPTSVIEYKVD